MMKPCAICLLLCCFFVFLPDVESAEKPEIVSVAKIWDSAQHSAFTDLIRFEGKWYCTFRESDRHVYGKDGTIRVIVSPDGTHWESAALLEVDGVDLRDPKLSFTPEGRLMIVAGGSVYKEKELITRRPRVSFSSDGQTWTPMEPVLEAGDWLWRVTWHDGRAYGVSYDISEEQWALKLFSSPDGIHYQLVTRLEVPGKPNETTLRFLPDDTMIALIRREGKEFMASIGSSKPPYTQWSFHDTDHRVGGPDFIVLPNGRMWASGRSYPGGAKTVLATFGPESYDPVLTLPSGGDTSYPGMVWHEGHLWMSYYSSHEGKTAIYLAKIKLPE